MLSREGRLSGKIRCHRPRSKFADRGRMTTSTDPVVSAQHHELVKDELFAFARYLYDEIESHTSVNITFDESVWDYT